MMKAHRQQATSLGVYKRPQDKILLPKQDIKTNPKPLIQPSRTLCTQPAIGVNKDSLVTTSHSKKYNLETDLLILFII